MVIHKINNHTMLATILLILLQAGACSKGNSGGFLPVIIDRNATLVAWQVDKDTLSNRFTGEVSSIEPMEIAMLVSATLAGLPPDGPVIIRREIDFGDGQGWTDVTSEALNWDFGDGSGHYDINRLTRHVYTEPGEYLIRGRVTYWDGEVIHTSGYPEDFINSSDVLVRILPLEETAE